VTLISFPVSGIQDVNDGMQEAIAEMQLHDGAQHVEAWMRGC